MVGHDWGAVMAWYFCLFRPDRVKALVNLSVAFRPRHPSKKPVETMRALLGENYYICRFQVLLLSLRMFVCNYGCTGSLIFLVAWRFLFAMFGLMQELYFFFFLCVILSQIILSNDC